MQFCGSFEVLDVKKVAFFSFVAALGGILFGCDTAVISETIAEVGCAAAGCP